MDVVEGGGGVEQAEKREEAGRFRALTVDDVYVSLVVDEESNR